MVDKKKILKGHRRIRNKFIPPSQAISFTEIHYVEDLLPELVWIQYLLFHLGTTTGIKILLEFARVRCSLEGNDSAHEAALLSSYNNLTRDHWNQLIEGLREKHMLGEITAALRAFVRTYPKNNPFKNLYFGQIGDVDERDVDLARRVIHALFDRRSKDASIIQVAVLAIHLSTGKLKLTSNVSIPDLSSIFDDFDSDDAQRVCSHARMNLNSSVMHLGDKEEGGWAKYFWNRGRELSPLETEIAELDLERSSIHPVQEFGFEFESYARGLLTQVWRMLPVDIYQSETYEVLGALMARQCNLAIKVICNPDLWDYYSGPLFLRAMTDCYITLAWILKDPLERSRKFILYGLGQEKLRVEHLKAELDSLETEEEKEALQEQIDVMVAWADSQRYMFLQEVDIGSWSGISTRKMAEEADCLSLYTFAYKPWSDAAHGCWNHLGKFEVKSCTEPLHKYIRQPFYFRHQEIDVVVNTAKYLDKLFVHVVEYYSLEMKVLPPYRWVLDKLDELYEKLEDYQS